MTLALRKNNCAIHAEKRISSSNMPYAMHSCYQCSSCKVLNKWVVIIHEAWLGCIFLDSEYRYMRSCGKALIPNSTFTLCISYHFIRENYETTDSKVSQHRKFQMLFSCYLSLTSMFTRFTASFLFSYFSRNFSRYSLIHNLEYPLSKPEKLEHLTVVKCIFL